MKYAKKANKHAESFKIVVWCKLISQKTMVNLLNNDP